MTWLEFPDKQIVIPDKFDSGAAVQTLMYTLLQAAVGPASPLANIGEERSSQEIQAAVAKAYNAHRYEIMNGASGRNLAIACLSELGIYSWD